MHSTIGKERHVDSCRRRSTWQPLIVGYTHLLRVFYAADEDEVQQKKSDLEHEINAVCKSLEHYPYGFRLVRSTLPGTVEVTEH